MPFAQRDHLGKINAVYELWQEGYAEEWLDQDSPELLPTVEQVKGDRISKVQSAYESDHDKLNRAWLSAMIADGVEETARKTAIEGEMTALDAQLEIDILTIIMEA